GDVVSFAAQAVAEPGADRRPPGLLVAGSQESDRRVVVDRFRKHRTDDRNLVHDAANVRYPLAQLDAAPAIALERIRRTDTEKRLLSGSHSRDALAHPHARRKFLAGHLGELRFRIEQVDV